MSFDAWFAEKGQGLIEAITTDEAAMRRILQGAWEAGGQHYASTWVAMDPWCFSGWIRRTIDGDTTVMHLDLGFGIWMLATKVPEGEDPPEARYPQGRYRLYGIDAPDVRSKDPAVRETERAAKDAATSRVRDLLERSVDRNGRMTRVKVKIHKDRAHGKFRYMVEIFLRVTEDDGSLSVAHLNAQLIEEGHAVPYFGGKK